MSGQDMKAGKLRILHTEKEKRGPYSFRDFKCHIHAGKNLRYIFTFNSDFSFEI